MAASRTHEPMKLSQEMRPVSAASQTQRSNKMQNVLHNPTNKQLAYEEALRRAYEQVRAEMLE